MRDSNYTFPMQNRVCVSITAQLYDRRALDTSAPLPLLNSLTHLTYLSSTSPRIREILTVDGGLERLLEILQESALPRPPSPPPDWYSLRGPTTASILTQSQQNSLRHSLAFQCIVNIGVRGSEAIRTRVVESGALDVVAQIMEVWLKGKGMSIVSGPLGSQAAVDRASREGIIPGQHRSRDRRHRTEEEREKDRERKARQEAKLASTEVQAESSTPVPNPCNASGPATQSDAHIRQQLEAIGSTQTTPAQRGAVTSGISASRPPHPMSGGDSATPTISREDLDSLQLLPIDDPTPEQAARMTVEQRATIIRLNAIGRLAGMDRDDLWQSLATDPLSTDRLRDYFRQFGLDVSTLDILRAQTTPLVRIPTSRLAADRHAHEIRRIQRSAAATEAAEEDVTMEEDGGSTNVADGTGGTSSRRDTITSSTAIPPLASQIEAMTPRAPSAPLPANSDYFHPSSHEQTNAMLQPRLIRAENVEEMAILDQGNQVTAAESPLGQSTSSSTSALSLMGEDGALPSGPEIFAQAESSSSAQARARNIFEARSGLLPAAPAIDMSNISNTSTPVGTPPVSYVGHRDRSRTITNGQRDPAVQPTGRQAESEEPIRAPSRTGDADRPISRAGTEDDESADGDQMGDAMDEQIGIVGSADEDDGMAALDTMQRGIGGDTMEAIDGVDANAQAQAEVDLAMGAPPGAPGAAQTPRIPEMTPRQALRPILPPNNTQDPRDFAGGPAVVIAAGAPRSFSDLSNLVNVLETTSTTNESTYSDDTLLLCLQLLAYLSKYPHVRAAFHHPRRPMHPDVHIPADVPLPDQPFVSESTNMFSLVERFTFRPSPPDPDLVKLPADIQYWAGVIMRNACRKDELHGGVRQCANMSCGRLETFPREFAKCRRCRKAKYCSKECQSKGWQEGHRFWCNARDAEPDNPIAGTVIIPSAGARAVTVAGPAANVGWNPDPALEAARRRHQRLRDRSHETQADVDMRRRTDVTPAAMIPRIEDRRQRSTDSDAMDIDTDAPPAARRLETVGEVIPPTPVIPHTQIRQQPSLARALQSTWHQ